MKQLELVIENQTGLHARPAQVLVKLAKQFKADIRIECNQKRANAKSMVSVLTLGAACGSRISVEANGEDEDVALTRIAEAIRSKLGDVDAPAAQPAATPGPQLCSQSKPEQASPQPAGSIQGVGAGPGIAAGPLFQFQSDDLTRINLELLAGSEQLSLDEALLRAKLQLAALHQQMVEKKLGAEAAIFEAQCEFLDDLDLIGSVQERIAAGLNAASAWQTAIDERAKAIAALGDACLAARADDLRDAGGRVLGLMLGVTDRSFSLPATPVVIVARDLCPSAMAAFDAERVLGFVTVNGGPTSHVAILARALGLPAIVGVEESVLALADQTMVVVNGNDGTLIVDPSPEVLDRSTQARNLWLESRRRAQQGAHSPAVTLDGRRVNVTANAGSANDAPAAMKMGADGIGLLRTEFLFLDRSVAPTEDEQFGFYRGFAEAMPSLPVIIRTLDIGGDKPLAYIHLSPEANPFLGERGIRLCLNHLELFREQLRAILRAAPYGNLQIMFPMVSDIGELQQARELVEQQRREMGTQPIKLGIMVEVPSAALLADKLAPHVDFFSIGTNDLTQYTLAMDRGHAGLAARQDGLHPAVLRLIARTVEAAHKLGKPVDLCGELGSDPLAIPILIGLGVDELSVSIPAIPVVKQQVRTLTLGGIEPLARKALECSTAAEVRELVRAFAA
jgi:phosphocarrier protein FPr